MSKRRTPREASVNPEAPCTVGAETANSTFLDIAKVKVEYVQDPRLNTTGFTYDSRNRLTRVTHPDQNSKTFVYDLSDNKIGEKDERGNWSVRIYDVLNRVSAQGRDLNGTVTETNGTVNLPTLTLEARPADVRLATDIRVDYTYNNVGSVLTVSDPRNYTTTHTYDAAQRLISTQTPHSSNDDGGAVTYVTTYFAYKASYGAAEGFHAGASPRWAALLTFPGGWKHAAPSGLVRRAVTDISVH